MSPLLKGKANVGKNIRELHGGKMYERVMRKYGKAKADEVAVAAAMSAARGGKRRRG